MELLPKVFRGLPRELSLLNDDQRRALGFSHLGSIVDITTDVGVQAALDYAYEKGVVSMDTETTGLNPFIDKIILVQIGDEERQHLIWWQVLSSRARRAILDLWGDRTVRKAGFNLKFDGRMILGNAGMEYRGDGLIDCQLIEQMLHCGLTGDIGLTLKLTGMGETAKRWLGWKLPKDEDIRTGWGNLTPGDWTPSPEAYARQVPEGLIPFEVWAESLIRKRYYAADDCVIPMRVLDVQVPWVKRFHLEDTVKLEMAFLPDLIETEMRGLPIDWDRWADLATESGKQLTLAAAALDQVFDVTVTYAVDLDGTCLVSRDKNYASNPEVGDLIRDYMWEHHGVDVIGNNGHLKASLARAGVNPLRYEHLFKAELVPNPAKVGKRMRIGYDAMTDYIDDTEGRPNLYAFFRKYLPPKHFVMLGTDSKLLKLLRILWETPDDEIDDIETIPSKIGLPPALIDPMLAQRKYAKRESQYSWNWKGMINPVTGRVHPDMTQTCADTGRLTSRDPNLQNLPTLQAYRTAVCYARPGYKIVGADLNQIEPRIIGEMSGCPMYMRVFWSESPGTEGFEFWCDEEVTESLDLYGAVGAEIGVLPREAAKKSEAKKPENSKGRKQSKISVLGLGYGTGKPKFHIGVCIDMGYYVSRTVTDELFDHFWTAAQEVKCALDKCSNAANPERSQRKLWHPYVEKPITWAESLGGRKRFFKEDSPQWWTQGRNMPVQATGADILKSSVVLVSKYLRKNKIDGGVIMTAHDELVLEIEDAWADRVAEQMEQLMSRAGQKYCPSVPITAEAYVADHWVKD